VSRRKIPASPPGAEPEQEEARELTLADHVPDPGEVFGALRSAVEGLPGTVIEIADLAPDMLGIPDWEAGS
jgi:hypothetical protein